MDPDSENITKIIAGFRQGTLSYNEYLRLSNIPDTYSANQAYINFKSNGEYITVDDLKSLNNPKSVKGARNNMQENKKLKDLSSEELADQLDRKGLEYCVTKPSDAVCSCLLPLSSAINDYNKRYKAWKDSKEAKLSAFKVERQVWLDSYNALIKDLEKEVGNELHVYYLNQDPKQTQNPDYRVQMTKTGTFKEYRDWRWYWSESYKKKTLDAKKLEEPKLEDVMKKIEPAPVFQPKIECCNNVITGYESAVMEKINQNCAQSSGPTIKPTQEEIEAARAEEEAIAAAKIQEQEEAEAAEKNKKILIILGVIFGLLLVVGLGVGIFIYTRSSAAPSPSPSSSPSP